jgi:hypothetical protein
VTFGPASRRSDERGIALTSPVAALSLAAVALAGIAFMTTGGEPDADPEATRQVTASASASASAAPTPTATAPTPVVSERAEPSPSAEPKTKNKPRKPAVRRGNVYVEVYNNSGISGLAGSTASKMAGAGWQVVGSDNWYGTIPESTVYYPGRLQAAARLAAKDLGITRLKPAISPMKFDRLTVILTSGYTSG